MLNDLRKYDCLGTPNYFIKLINALRDDSRIKWERPDLESLFYNRVIDNRPIIDGGIDFAIRICLIQMEDDHILLNPQLKTQLNNRSQVIDSIIRLLINHLKNDEDFLNIFSSRYLSYDLVHKSLQIDNSAFGFKFSNFKQLLLDFGIIQCHPTPNFTSYIVSNRYKKLLDDSVLPEIKKKRIGVEEFKRSMEQLQIHGEEAEKFVLNFENERLNFKKSVDWVAEYVVNAGYDIASYDKEEDNLPNRFIEVKSYDGPRAYFFWSRNEFKVAQLKGRQYWIYLVNRSKSKKEGYVPEMYQDPFNTILGNRNPEWIEEVDKYRIIANI
jgi:hypothetical protein